MIKSKIIADSICNNHRITSMILTIPQIVVKELLRHRMFSFSSSSMRAIPFNKVLDDVKNNMFIPSRFQTHHVGMQGYEYLKDDDENKAKNQWIKSALFACEEAEKLYNIGVTKQLCSRIIEPYGFATILVTATEWENFFSLRCPQYEVGWYPSYRSPEALEPTMSYFRSKKDAIKRTEGVCDNWTDNMWRDSNISQAEIHIQSLAECMWDAYNESVPKKLKCGEYHIPFIDIEEDL